MKKNKKSEKLNLFTDEEAEKIILMSVAHKAQTDEQMKKTWDWACECRIRQLMLECVLQGKVAPFVTDDGELRFKKMEASA